MKCEHPTMAPITAYRKGCRCERCATWRRAYKRDLAAGAPRRICKRKSEVEFSTADVLAYVEHVSERRDTPSAGKQTHYINGRRLSEAHRKLIERWGTTREYAVPLDRLDKFFVAYDIRLTEFEDWAANCATVDSPVGTVPALSIQGAS
jgi:hypothetical protein